VERRRVELPTSALRTCGHPDATEDTKELASTPPPVCTRVCTSEGENLNARASDAASLATSPEAGDTPGDHLAKSGKEARTEQGIGAPESHGEPQVGSRINPAPGDALAAIAAAVAGLSPADRARLVGMLAADQGRGEGEGR